MAIRDIFTRRDVLYAAASSVVPANAPAGPGLSLPHGILSNTLPLAAVVFPDLDASEWPVTAGQALTVPAVKRAVSLYSTLSSRFFLDSDDNSTPWLNESSGAVTPQVRIAWTIQDLIFYNCSLWSVERDAFGTITAAEHVSRDRWSQDTNGAVLIDQKPFNQRNLIYFVGLLPGSGFLEDGRQSVRQYLSIAQTINNRAAMPSPVTLVKETQDTAADADEVSEAMDQLKDSLTSKRGGMVFVPHGIDIEGYGAGDNANEMQIAARNAIRLDLANHLSINASLLEGSADGSSDSYTNTLMVQNELLELSVKGFTEAIATRLSANDVTPEGTKVLFDYSTFDTAPNDSTSKGTVPAETIEVTE